MNGSPSSFLVRILIGSVLLSNSGVDAFAPTTTTRTNMLATTTTTTTTTLRKAGTIMTVRQNPLHLHHHPSLLLSEVVSDSLAATTTGTTNKAAGAIMDIGATLPEAGGGGGIVDIAKNIAFAITAVLFLGAGLTLVTASIIVPAAAKELETECKDLSPELWDEYSAMLKEGETMANRPDLMQELGAKLQPLLDAKIERQFEEQKAKGIDVSQDEQAWKAIDSLNKKVPKPDNSEAVFGRKEDKSSSSSSTSGIVTDQWED